MTTPLTGVKTISVLTNRPTLSCMFYEVPLCLKRFEANSQIKPEKTPLPWLPESEAESVATSRPACLLVFVYLHCINTN